MAEPHGARPTGHRAAVLGYLDGEPIGREPLDRRLDAMRRSPRSAMLPAPGSAEDRQLARWLTQVILTEALCEAEAAARNLPLDPRRFARLDHQAAVEYGSINAAAFQGSPAVRALARDVTAQVSVAEEDLRRYWAATARPVPARWVLRHRLDGAPAHHLGPVGALDLPAALAGALLGAAPGDTVTAVDALGRHEAQVLEVLPAQEPGFERDAPRLRARLVAAARRRAFAHWLDTARAHRIRLVPGLEHPGDPRQPDNHHRH
jgi:[acyl-carrier-protein] S-malonyltransferase